MAQKPKLEKDKKTIILKESQRISLVALELERQKIEGEIKQLQAGIQQRVSNIAENKASTGRILIEIEDENELARESLGTTYVFDGKEFVKVGK